MRRISARAVVGLVGLALPVVPVCACRKQQPAKAPPARMAPAAPPGPAAATQAAAARGARPAIRRVVIVSEDGLRPDALSRVSAPVHEKLMKRGAYSLEAHTIRNASTLPSHAAMLSGFDVKEHGLFWNSWKPERGWIHVPTVFDAAGKGKSAAFVGKKKLAHIAHPGAVEVFSRPGYYCKKVVAEAAKYFVEKKPEIEFIHFSDPDDLGHSDGWMSDPMLEAVTHSDRCLGLVVDAIETAGLDRETLLIVSADHGGHGRNHSGKLREDRLIPWFAWGPGVRPGHRIKAPISTVDTAATALWALGYPAPPGLKGRPVLEAFDLAQMSPPPPRPAPAPPPVLAR